MPQASKLLPSLGHALSGATATSLSTLLLYPLDLATTRLKVQRQLISSSSPSSSSSSQQYTSLLDALCKIYSTEGGPPALFVGLRPDLAKSVADSFLFFLFYNWFRGRVAGGGGGGDGIGGKRRGLRVWEELAVGAVAGAASRFWTQPVGVVVARMQLGGVVGDEKGKSFWEVVREIWEERGVQGLWAGYEASLILTVNPSLTFWLQRVGEKAVIGGEHEERGMGGLGTFMVAAGSKVVATAVTYPVQIAKARVQIASSPKGSPTRKGVQRSIGRETIFGTVLRISRTEGLKALYDGIGGELLKGFFSHGTTMVAKDIIHGLLVRFYLALIVFLQRYPQVRARFLERGRQAHGALGRAYRMTASLLTRTSRQGAQKVGNDTKQGGRILRNVLLATGDSIKR